MTQSDILFAQIENGYRLSKDPDRRPILNSAFDVIEAAAVTHTHATLNAAQVGALFTWIQSQQAAHSLGLRETAKDVATTPTTPTNVIPFNPAAASN